MDKNCYKHISEQTNDPIIKRKTCEISWTEFPIYQSDLDFYKKVSPIFEWKKYNIPTPRLCPQERERRRMNFRNERKLYRRKCDATWENIISIYSDDKEYKVYKQNFWRSDKWDPLKYWINFDFSKSFFEQFDKLMKDVPQMNLTNLRNENSNYCNYLNDSRNCYLACASWSLEDSIYCNRTYEWKNLVDCSFCFRWENSYMNINCEDFYWSKFCRWCKQISNCNYCINCFNSKDCIWSINLVWKQYNIFNQQYTKHEYEVEKNKLLSEPKYIKNKLLELENNSIKPSLKTTNSEKTFGNNIKNSKNIIASFELDRVENAKYCRECANQKNIMDVNNNLNSELEYEIMGFWYNNKVSFTLYSAECVDVYYSAYCQYSKNLFGCIWLRNKEYCIFNKQYSKQEYNKLVSKIIEHMENTWEWGEFFPVSISPWAYNETHANIYYPLEENEAKRLWYKRMNKEIPINIPNSLKTINAEDLELNIEDIESDLLTKAIICKETKKPYRLIPREINFYKKNNISLPKEHYDLRYLKRSKYTSDTELYLIECNKCKKKTISIYQNDKNTYCKNCYNSEIYS